MQFSSSVIDLKQRYLDSILEHQDILDAVLSRHLSKPYSLTLIPRLWSPGGGATLFRIESGEQRWFLKVKLKEVLVESRLESEENFLQIPSLRNEADFLALLTSPEVPAVFFYDEHAGYSFLAMEWLAPFMGTADSLTLGDLLEAWNSLEQFVEKLFSLGIVHTDLHEGNLCFRGTKLVVCDFEEARYLTQDLPITQSLDVCGLNRYGNVGHFPSGSGAGIPGLTCLGRLRAVFATKMRHKLSQHLSECQFDLECPFNLDVLQQADTRVYQTITLAGLKIEGQRPARDSRKAILLYLLLRAALTSRRPVRHLDLGSNLGVFSLIASSYSWVEGSWGLEAYPPYVQAARALAFVTGRSQAHFFEFVCGKGLVEAVMPQKADLCTMLSVYHHIADRMRFLEDLARIRPERLLAEFAVQSRYYPDHGGLVGEIEYIRKSLGYNYSETIMVSGDYQRPLVLFSDRRTHVLERGILKLFSVSLLAAIAHRTILTAGRIVFFIQSLCRSRQ